MARIGETQAVVSNAGQNVVENAVVAQEKPVPDNVVTLSSGVRVQFLGALPATTAQQIVVTTFQDANLDANGNVKADMSSIEQLKLAKRMFDYNRSILSFALSMRLIKLYDGLPKDSEWLDYLEVNPQVRNDMPDINFHKRVHQELLYLMYIAFATEEDLGYISEKLLNR
jgi:hypothetical protein